MMQGKRSSLIYRPLIVGLVMTAFVGTSGDAIAQRVTLPRPSVVVRPGIPARLVPPDARPAPSGPRKRSREELIRRGSFEIVIGVPMLYHSTHFLGYLGCMQDGEEFSALACMAGGTLGIGLLIGGLTLTTAGTIMLVKGLRMEPYRGIEPRIGVDARRRPHLHLRIRL